jgi:hypothetical protein
MIISSSLSVSPVAALFAPSILVLKVLLASDMKLSAEAETQAAGSN